MLWVYMYILSLLYRLNNWYARGGHNIPLVVSMCMQAGVTCTSFANYTQLESGGPQYWLWGTYHWLWGMYHWLWGTYHWLWGMCYWLWGVCHWLWGVYHWLWEMYLSLHICTEGTIHIKLQLHKTGETALTINFVGVPGSLQSVAEWSE